VLKRFRHINLAVLVMFILGLALGMSVLNPGVRVSGQDAGDSETQLLRGIYAKVNPSVVSIAVRIPQSRASGNSSAGSPNGAAQPFAYAAGSGFLYDNQGDIVTNAHVVEGTDRVEVTFGDDVTMHAKIVGVDLDSDLAVIKAEGDVSKYQPLPLADSDQVMVGDRAIAIGNPFQRSGTMTQGIVSGVKRSVDGLAQTSNGGAYTIPDAIQTDAALNPGNSGGPLLNNQGQVIGVNEQIASEVRQSSGVSFSIPSNLVKIVAEALVKDGKIEHPYLGISGGSLSLDINDAMKLPAETRGAYVSGVSANGPAAKAGNPK